MNPQPESHPSPIWSAQFGPTLVTAVQGDITDERVDAILNSANTWMILGGRHSVAGRIDYKTNGRVAEALSRIHTPVELGEVVITDGFGLPCKHIFHIATHGTQEEERSAGEDDLAIRMEAVNKGITRSVEKARELQLTSIAMPLFATGSLGYPARIMIDVILNTLDSELREDTGLREVRILTFRNERTHAELGLALQSRGAAAAGSSQFLRQLDAVGLASAAAAIGVVDSGTIGGLVGAVVGGLIHKWGAPDESKSATAAPSTPESVDRDTHLRQAIALLRAENLNLRERLRVLEEEKARQAQDISPAPSPQLPLPVAFAVSMAASETSPPLQVENLRRAFSILVKYLAVIGLSEYKGAGLSEKALNQEISKMLRKPLTDGSWLKLATSTARALGGANGPTLVREYPALLFHGDGRFSDANRMLYELLKHRNQVHDNNPFDESTATGWLESAAPLWQGILPRIAPVMQYGLVYVDDLIDFGLADPEAHQYHIRWLMGEHFVPRAEIVEWRAKLRKGRLFLKHPSEERFLPLHPFLLYEHCTLTRARETWCIDGVWEDAVSFSTFRFPYKWRDTACVGEFRNMFGPSN